MRASTVLRMPKMAEQSVERYVSMVEQPPFDTLMGRAQRPMKMQMPAELQALLQHAGQTAGVDPLVEDATSEEFSQHDAEIVAQAQEDLQRPVDHDFVKAVYNNLRKAGKINLWPKPSAHVPPSCPQKPGK